MEYPKVTEGDLDAAIRKSDFILLPDNKTTICMLTLDNGFTVRGESSCVDPRNYVRDVGEKYAYKDARSKLWPLLGFRLADRLAFGTVARQSLSEADAQADLEGNPRPA